MRMAWYEPAVRVSFRKGFIQKKSNQSAFKAKRAEGWWRKEEEREEELEPAQEVMREREKATQTRFLV